MPDAVTLGALGVGYWLSRGLARPYVRDDTTARVRAIGHEVEVVSGRGLVLPLTVAQRVVRALYLAGEVPTAALDPYVRTLHAPPWCPDLYYRLSEFNGGKDPTAPDPATRWIAEGGVQVNRTSDCVGGAAWCGGFDRYQPARFAHLYEGWINTDSMLQDATTARRCFVELETARVGCFVVAASHTGGHEIGHIGVVVNVPSRQILVERSAAWWSTLGVVDIAARSGRANKRTTGAGWSTRDARFVESIMKP